MSELELKLAIYKAPLLVAAASNADPYPYACMVNDNFSPEQMTQYITADNWLDQLATILPEAKQHAQWFTDLRGEVLDLLKADAESVSLDGSAPT